MLGFTPPKIQSPAVESLSSADFRALLEAHVDYVHRSLRRLGIRRGDIDDLTQEVFLVVLRRWRDFDQARAVRPWLFGIAYRLAIAHVRKHHRELSSDALDDELHPQRDGDQQHESRALVLAALERIPLPRRAVFTLHSIDGVDMKDVARQLGVPLFTAYARLKKAREEFEAALRALLGRRQFSELVAEGTVK